MNIYFLSGKLKEDILRPEVVETVKYLTSDAFRLDESKRPKDDVPLQTFRKLNVWWRWLIHVFIIIAVFS